MKKIGFGFFILFVFSGFGWTQTSTPNSNERDLAGSKLTKEGVLACEAQDYPKAMKLLKKAAKEGSSEAEEVIGALYFGGKGVAQNYLEAMRWWKISDQHGNDDAAFRIASLYFNGFGVPQDYQETMAWSKKAAAQGNAGAEYNIGALYDKGYGVPRDEQEALKWYKKAAEHGEEHAIKTLEIMKENSDITTFSGQPEPFKSEEPELKRFKHKDVLINPLRHLPQIYGNQNRFDKDTLYGMNHFKIVQKIQGGYLITADPIVWRSGDSMEFDLAFLKTTKQLTPDLFISGVVYYAGVFQYTAISGFQASVPLLKIPVGQPLLGVHKGGDPFKQDKY